MKAGRGRKIRSRQLERSVRSEVPIRLTAGIDDVHAVWIRSLHAVERHTAERQNRAHADLPMKGRDSFEIDRLNSARCRGPRSQVAVGGDHGRKGGRNGKGKGRAQNSPEKMSW